MSKTLLFRVNRDTCCSVILRIGDYVTLLRFSPMGVFLYHFAAGTSLHFILIWEISVPFCNSRLFLIPCSREFFPFHFAVGAFSCYCCSEELPPRGAFPNYFWWKDYRAISWWRAFSHFSSQWGAFPSFQVDIYIFICHCLYVITQQIFSCSTSIRALLRHPRSNPSTQLVYIP